MKNEKNESSPIENVINLNLININSNFNFNFPTNFTTISKKDYKSIFPSHQQQQLSEENINFDIYTTTMDQIAHKSSQTNRNNSGSNGNTSGDNRNKTTTTTTTSSSSSSSSNNNNYRQRNNNNNNNNYNRQRQAQHQPHNKVEDWNVDKVIEWLKQNKFEEQVDKFREQMIDGITLNVICDLKQDDKVFEKLGFIHIGPKLNFQKLLKQLISQQHQQPQLQHHNNQQQQQPRSHHNNNNNYNQAINKINKKQDQEKSKREQFVKFDNTYGMEVYLENKLKQAQQGEDIVELLHYQLIQLQDIISRPQLPNRVIELIIQIYVHPKFECSTFETFTNKLISELRDSNFVLSILNLTRYIQEMQYDFQFREVIDLMNLITSKFADSIQRMPLEIFESRFKLNNQINGNDHIKSLIGILKQKKLVQQEYFDLNSNGPKLISNDEIVYKNRSIIPSAEEIRSKSLPPLRPLKLGVYKSPEEYLDTQFNLLREDMIHPIREALSLVENGKSSQYLYNDVIFKGFTKTNTSLCLLIEFKYKSIIKWEKFGKLLTGSLLVLSCDNFQTCLFATVDKRPDKGNVQQISISFFNNEQDDHGKSHDLTYLFENSFTMIESPTYFESVRNVLSSLQSIDPEQLPFQSYLLRCSSQEIIPKYFQDNPVVNLFQTFPKVERINLKTSEFPETLDTLDPSQVEAFEHCLKSEMSLVQGPPGTGKSFIGVKLFQVIFNHLSTNTTANNNAPIIVLCYTNHALDQFVKGILKVTNSVIRIGSRSRDEEMKKYNIRNFLERDKRQMPYYFERDNVITALKHYLDHFSEPLSYQDFLDFSVNDDGDEEQQDQEPSNKHLYTSSYQWIIWMKSIKAQIKKDLSILNLPKQQSTKALDEDEDDQDDEELVENLLNERMFDFTNYGNGGGNDKNIDISDYDIQNVMAMSRLEKKDFNEINDISTIPEKDRILYYRYLLSKKITKSLKEIEIHSANYKRLSNIIMDYENKSYQRALTSTRVVAATITGASRLKKVFDSINSKCVIIEEAAEVLEGHIVSVLPKTINHLILIGDHEQLKPSCAVYQLAEKFKLNVSLFERIMKNGGAHRQLTIQRRMVPNISQFITPIYPNLRNHPEVRKRFESLRIRGMPSNVFFLTHSVYETMSKDVVGSGGNGKKESKSMMMSTSKSNLHEAEFVASLAHYLLKQNYSPEDIVILTPYTGQLLKIKSQIHHKNYPLLSKVQVRSVDQYQGEESDIVILSLVRSNPKNDSGFVKIKNRINVAISRARNAMYMIGNSDLLSNANPLWANMFSILNDPANPTVQFGTSIPVRCENHPDQVTEISCGKDFSNVPDGGCLKSCDVRLEQCGHVCPRSCHSYDMEHLDVKCTKPCEKVHSKCGHKCLKLCSIDCGQCIEPVLKQFPCGHKKKVACHIEDFKCTEPCTKTKSCGHPCTRNCSDRCDEIKCEIKVQRTLICGHTEERECYNSSQICNRKCKDKLPCGDICSAKCRDHKKDPFTNQTIHPQCSKTCTRTLFCGHTCNTKHKCGESICAPCEKPCNNSCQHSKCNKKCNKLCTGCNEQCKRGCKHVGRCNKKCNDPCSIKQCVERCDKPLKCKHQCIGICGEPCVTLCAVCNPTYQEPITLMKLSEFDIATDRFIEVHKGHVFHIDSLDQYMNTKDDDGRISLKKCPSCNMIISLKELPRYKDQINESWKNIDAIKRKLMEAVTKEEIESVRNAMGGAAGHWFKCPNGHFYFIGECGGAMQTSKCIECKEQVGGSNHQLLNTNQHAGEIDNSTQPLYQPFIRPNDLGNNFN